MSHFTKIDTKIRDIAALKSACTELGLDVKQNTMARGFGSNCRRGRYVIKLTGPFDVAINPGANGEWELQADMWGEYVEKDLGKNLGRLRQAYAIRKTMAEANKRGLRVRRTNLQDGRVRLALTGV
jgi:hypothetical protein